MKYKKGYKYQLVEDEVINLPGWFMEETGGIETDFITINDVCLVIKKGYAWDGASGIPDIANQRASAGHDAFYQMFRLGLLSKDKYKAKSDALFMAMCIEEGTPFLVAQLYYTVLEKFGDRAASKRRKIYEC